MKKELSAFALIVLIFLSLVGMATGEDKILTTKPTEEYGICDILTLVNNVVNVVIKGIIPVIATAIIAWAGFRIVTHQGDTDVVKQSKMVFLAVAIGLVVIFASYAIVSGLMAGMGYKYDWNKCQTP